MVWPSQEALFETAVMLFVKAEFRKAIEQLHRVQVRGLWVYRTVSGWITLDCELGMLFPSAIWMCLPGVRPDCAFDVETGP